MLPELRMLDFGSLAFVRGHKNCQRFLRQPLTHSIRNAHELLATRLIERRNSMGLERERWSVTQSGDLVRTPPPAARSDVDDDDAADALHLLIALPRTQCAEAQKVKFAAMMLESEGSIIKDVEVPNGIWVTTPLGRVLKGGVKITTAGCLWGCGRRRAHPKILVPKVNGWSGGGVFGADTSGANVLESLEKSLAMSSDASESEALLRNRTGELDAKGCNLMSWTPYGEARYATSSNDASESDQGLVIDQIKVDANWLVAHRFGDWAEYFNRRTEATLCTFRGVAVADPKARIEWLDFTDKSHNTALQLAIKHGEIAIAERLIARNRSTECQVRPRLCRAFACPVRSFRRACPAAYVHCTCCNNVHEYVQCAMFRRACPPALWCCSRMCNSGGPAHPGHQWSLISLHSCMHACTGERCEREAIPFLDTVRLTRHGSRHESALRGVSRPLQHQRSHSRTRTAERLRVAARRSSWVRDACADVARDTANRACRRRRYSRCERARRAARCRAIALQLDDGTHVPACTPSGQREGGGIGRPQRYVEVRPSTCHTSLLNS